MSEERNKRGGLSRRDFVKGAAAVASLSVGGGVHGAVRRGSVAMTDCVVFGRIAGTNAAKEKPWS